MTRITAFTIGFACGVASLAGYALVRQHYRRKFDLPPYQRAVL